MSDGLAKVQTAAVIVGAIAVLFVGYKLYRGASNIGAGVGAAVDAATDAAKGAVLSGRNVVVNTYDGLRSIVSNRQYFSPSAMEGSLTRERALKLADDIAQDERDVASAVKTGSMTRIQALKLADDIAYIDDNKNDLVYVKPFDGAWGLGA